MAREFSPLFYLSKNDPKIRFKTNFIFYLTSKVSLENILHRQNSLIEVVRGK